MGFVELLVTDEKMPMLDLFQPETRHFKDETLVAIIEVKKEEVIEEVKNNTSLTYYRLTSQTNKKIKIKT